MSLTADRIRYLLSYDPETGIFRWKTAPGKRTDLIGNVAGTAHIAGYLAIGIGQTRYLSHRLAWLYRFGEWPPQFIDHINGDKTDNRIANLRLASNSQNLANANAQVNCVSGVRGVYLHKRSGRYRVQLGKDGKKRHIGYFDTLDEAVVAARRAARELHGAFAKS